MNVDEIWELLPEYFSGLCSAEQSAAIDSWIAADSAVRRRVERERRLWELAGRLVDPVPVADTDAALGRLKARIAAAASSLAPSRRKKDPASRRSPLVVAAARTSSSRIGPQIRRSDLLQRRYVTSHYAIASILAVVGCLAVLLRYRAGLQEDRSASSLDRERIYSTLEGQRSKFNLPDGSTVSLAPVSRLAYSERHRGVRDVALVGEAYFEVEHNPRSQFVVRTRNAVTIDIGTSFVVRGYATDTDVRVLVTKGSVSLHASGDAAPAVLVANTVGTVGHDGITRVARTQDNDPLLAWTSGQLAFSRTSLSDAVRDLGRWYGLDVSLADSSMGSLPISGFLPSASATDALDALATLARARWQRQGRSVTLCSRISVHQRSTVCQRAVKER